MSYESLLNDMFYRKINTQDVCDEDTFLLRIEKMLLTKLHSGRMVKWNATKRIDLLKRAYGLNGKSKETFKEIGSDLNLNHNYLMNIANRTMRFIEYMVVDHAGISNITYEEAIFKLFKD